ncbi:hypothetical protein [Shewanella youngdeokensis]|uniref:Uncharacterized protein n=1 Tax=Shewanella youngdeokensis TaxID=2999068 RepID=A0ABZ0K1Q0_9GAMM|nr:hypothetical protein RGE70_02470 [Shewanella sp. DAU334]
MQTNVIIVLKRMHWLGFSLLLSSTGLYSFTEIALEVTGMVLIACLAGLGMVLMSPFPIALFLQWAQKQNID